MMEKNIYERNNKPSKGNDKIFRPDIQEKAGHVGLATKPHQEEKGPAPRQSKRLNLLPNEDDKLFKEGTTLPGLNALRPEARLVPAGKLNHLAQPVNKKVGAIKNTLQPTFLNDFQEKSRCDDLNSVLSTVLQSLQQMSNRTKLCEYPDDAKRYLISIDSDFILTIDRKEECWKFVRHAVKFVLRLRDEYSFKDKTILLATHLLHSVISNSKSYEDNCGYLASSLWIATKYEEYIPLSIRQIAHLISIAPEFINCPILTVEQLLVYEQLTLQRRNMKIFTPPILCLAVLLMDELKITSPENKVFQIANLLFSSLGKSDLFSYEPSLLAAGCVHIFCGLPCLDNSQQLLGHSPKLVRSVGLFLTKGSIKK